MADEWEYKEIEIDVTFDLIAEMNRWGKKGWEVVSQQRIPGGTYRFGGSTEYHDHDLMRITFKRRIQK